LFEVKHKNESKEITQVIDALNNKYGKNKVKKFPVGNREKEWL
jgi:DNA polymerase V